MNYIGEIKLFAGEFNPPGFINCDGSQLPIPLYRELFAVIGFTYTTEAGSSGGRGFKYFNLPTMTKGLVTGTRYIICVDGYFPKDQFEEIYSNPSGTLVAKGKLDSGYIDIKQKELKAYKSEEWINYNMDTDEFEG